MPKPQRSGYSYEVTDRTLNTDMEISSLRRVEFDTDETVITCSMILCNRVELEFFEAFERDCLRQGVRWFQMPLWVAGHLEWYNCCFVERPKIGGLIGVSHATVSMKLKIEWRDLLDPDIVEVLMVFGPAIGSSPVILNLDTGIAALAGVTNIPAQVWV
jgi:hypothetical protein